MPNHFLTVGLAATDWKRFPKDNDDRKERADALLGANLCQIVDPCPDALKSIVKSNVPSRWVNVETGEHYTGDEQFPGEGWKLQALSNEEIDDLVATHGAFDWYQWSKRWGTKWGTYDTKVHEMSGDGSPVMVEFQSAWGPPNAETMRKITDYLEERLYLRHFRWIGHDPGDGTTGDIEVDDYAEPLGLAQRIAMAGCPPADYVAPGITPAPLRKP